MAHTENRERQQSSLVYRKLAESIDLAALHGLNPSRYPFLLESVTHATGDKIGRFSILFAFPQNSFTLDSIEGASAFISQFDQAFATEQTEPMERRYPFKGGYFAYFSYDYAQVVEPVLSLPHSDLPLASLTRVPCAVMIDHQNDEMVLMAEQAFVANLDVIEQDLLSIHKLDAQPSALGNIEEEPEAKYIEGVNRIKEYILDGDIFQVNLSRQWAFEVKDQTALSIYHSLRLSNPAPFAALCHFEPSCTPSWARSEEHHEPAAWQIISSSPERLVSYDGVWVETRPIAGTRKRSENAERDKALIEELINHPKERAEHIMLIDLERNDLGRICQAGSVEVNELMVIESYEHVHHIVSNVRGKLKAGLKPLDILHAVFPGGTITGCPKIRCMEIIAELEAMPREAYTGSVGYINLDGSLDLNILIRSFVKRGDQLTFRAGAGIVADSIDEKELEESRHKAKGLINALI